MDQASGEIKKVNAEIAKLEQTSAKANVQLLSASDAQAQRLAKIRAELAATRPELLHSAQQYQNVAAATGKTTVALFGMNRMAETTRQGFTALRGSAMLLGMQVFPQMTAAVMGGTSAMQTMRGVSLLTGASFTAIGTAAAGLAAGIATVVTSFQALKAQQEEALSSDALMAQVSYQAMQTRALLRQLQADGKVTAEDFARMMAVLERPNVSFEGLRSVRAILAPIVRDSKTVEEALAGIADVDKAVVKDLLQGEQKVRFEINETFKAREKAITEQAEKIRSLPDLQVEAEQEIARAYRDNRVARDLALQQSRDREAKAEQDQTEKIAAQLEVRRNAEIAALSEIARIKDQARLATLDGLNAELAQIDARYDAEIDKIQELNLSLAEEAELIEAINRARAAEKGRATTKAHEEAKKAADAEIQEALRKQEAEKQIMRERLSATADMFQNMATLARVFGREGFAAWKALSIAEATITGIKMAMDAYDSAAKIPYIGFILAPIAAGAAAGAAAAQIAQIASTSYDVGGYTGPGGKYEPAGIVHRGEVVFSQEDVARIGLAPLLSLRRGDLDVPTVRGMSPLPGYASGGLVSTPSAPSTSINIAFLDSRQDRREWARREGVKIIASELRRRGNRISG